MTARTFGTVDSVRPRRDTAAARAHDTAGVEREAVDEHEVVASLLPDVIAVAQEDVEEALSRDGWHLPKARYSPQRTLLGVAGVAETAP